MKSVIEHRLATLESEQQNGRRALAELQDKRARLSETMLRIEGAMMVLRELLDGESAERSVEPSSEVGRREQLHQIAP